MNNKGVNKSAEKKVYLAQIFDEKWSNALRKPADVRAGKVLFRARVS